MKKCRFVGFFNAKKSPKKRNLFLPRDVAYSNLKISAIASEKCFGAKYLRRGL